MRSRYRQSINPWPFAIVNKKGNPGLNVTFWVVIYSNSEFIASKVPPKKNICTCNFKVNERYVGILQKKKKKKKKKTVLGVVCMLMTMWNVWAHEYLAILVGCQLFTAYWLSTIIWSRFVNESHEYLINSLIDHGGLTVYAFAQRKFY